jgi:hypothetical protein
VSTTYNKETIFFFYIKLKTLSREGFWVGDYRERGGRSRFWRTLQPCKGLGPVTFKMNTRDTHNTAAVRFFVKKYKQQCSVSKRT